MSELLKAIALGFVQGGAKAVGESAYPKVTAAAAALFSLIVEPVREHWPLFAAVAVLFFAIGFLAGWLRRGRRHKEEAEKAEANAAEEAESRRSIEQEKFRAMPSWMKGIMLAAHTRGGAYVRSDSWIFKNESVLHELYDYMHITRLSGNITEFTEKHKLADFYEGNADLFSAVRDFDRHAFYDPSRTRIPGRSAGSGDILWWWYTDEEPTFIDLDAERSSFVGYNGRA